MKPRSGAARPPACRRRALPAPASRPTPDLHLRSACRDPPAVVGNLDLQLCSRASQTGADPRARCVPEHIRESLLEDAEGRQRPPRGEVIQFAIDLEVHLEARAAHLSDEVFNTLKRQRRARSDPLAVGAEESKQPMHLLHRVAAHALHGQQRISLARLLRGKQPAYRACLHSHHADAVADHVVELPRDAARSSATATWACSSRSRSSCEVRASSRSASKPITRTARPTASATNTAAAFLKRSDTSPPVPHALATE